MHQDKSGETYRQGLALCRKGRFEDALRIFRKLVDDGSTDPKHLSYCGLLTATVDGKPRAGVELCRKAVSLGGVEPQLARNLARAYEAAGQCQQAVETLRRALRTHRKDPALLKTIQRLSPRSEPPIRALERDHFLNEKLGKLRARCLKSAPAQPAVTRRRRPISRPATGARRLRRA